MAYFDHLSDGEIMDTVKNTRNTTLEADRDRHTWAIIKCKLGMLKGYYYKDLPMLRAWRDRLQVIILKTKKAHAIQQSRPTAN